MDHLWSPWRYRYITQAEPAAGCIFCTKPAERNDDANYILYRGSRNFAILNLYPYTTGHLMIAPYEHVATLEQASEQTLSEMMLLTRRAAGHLREIYKPAGMNIGMNVGVAAGAGIAGHIHMHILPRWNGDTNFMTTVAENRVLPEALADSYAKLSQAFRQP